ncbi:MAG: hypothetical protein K0R55_188 [Sporomusa sp.]|nr:hypothetical protein [Sporomusa sp.]
MVKIFFAITGAENALWAICYAGMGGIRLSVKSASRQAVIAYMLLGGDKVPTQKSRKPRERTKCVFLGMEFKSNPGVIYPPDQIPQSERARLAQVIVNVLKQRNPEPDESGCKLSGQAGWEIKNGSRWRELMFTLTKGVMAYSGPQRWANKWIGGRRWSYKKDPQSNASLSKT